MPSFELNVSVNKQAFCRIVLPDTVKGGAQDKSALISKALQSSFGADAVDCELVQINQTTTPCTF